MLIIILYGLGILIFGAATWDGVYLKTTYNISKDTYDDEKNIMTETQFKLIRGGIQAASSHNMQPWKVKILDEKTFLLYADMEKALSKIDPENKQLLMSQGTFISSVKEAAKELGVMLDVQYSSVNLKEALPFIATFTILGDEINKVDAVSSATVGTKSQNSNFDIEKISNLIHETSRDYEVIWVNEDGKINFQDYLRKGTIIEANNQEAMEELLGVFRFTKWEKNKYRYGLSLNTISPGIRMFIEPIIGATARWKSFGQSSIATFEKRLEAEDGYLVLALEDPKPLDYILIGEVLTQLAIGVEGHTIRPAVQLLQPLNGISSVYNDLRSEYGIQGEIVQIIGFTKKIDGYHESVRHQVLDVIIE